MLFLSTLSLRRATHLSAKARRSTTNFYPRSPCGERPIWRRRLPKVCAFLSTLSLRRATFVRHIFADGKKFLSTLSLRRATLSQTMPASSIINFYPRSPCGERPAAQGRGLTTKSFLSTLSLRRATLPFLSRFQSPPNFYPRSPCGERPDALAGVSAISYFYPRSPCGERPPYDRQHLYLYSDFYPRSPCGERRFIRHPTPISMTYFYPRSPCGERRRTGSSWAAWFRFLSTLSLRRATAPAAQMRTPGGFLSTLSLRRATTQTGNSEGNSNISIHALLAESDNMDGTPMDFPR